MRESMKLLFVTPTNPSNTSFGSAQRSAWVYRALQSLGQVDVMLLREDESPGASLYPSPGVIADIVYKGSRLRRYAIDPEVDRVCRSLIDPRSYDAVVVRYVSLAAALPDLGPPTLVDADDAFYRYPSGSDPLSRLAAASRGWLRVAIGRRTLSRFAHVWFCSERDRSALRVHRSSILPNIVQVPEGADERTDPDAPGGVRKVILMVGSLWYGPNRAGIEWFLERCWQQIRQAEPAAVLRLVGAAPPDKRALWEQTTAVEAPGFVDDLRAEYQRACCTIAPIWSGGGSQIKVLESLAYGRMPVTTPYVADAFAPFLKGDHLLSVADSAVDMAARCVRALREPESTALFSAKAMPVLKAHFSWDTFLASVHDGVEMGLKVQHIVRSNA